MRASTCLIVRSGSRLRRRRGTPSRGGRHRPAARDGGAERDGRDRTDAARPPSPAHRRARPEGLAEGVRVHKACPGRGRDREVEAGDRRRAALAHGRASGDRGGGRRPCPQPHAGAGTPELRPHRLTPDGVGVVAPTPLIHAPRHPGVLGFVSEPSTPRGEVYGGVGLGHGVLHSPPTPPTVR